MHSDFWQQLLIGAMFSICVLLRLTSAEAGALEQRENLRYISSKAADDANGELDRAKAVLDAAINGKDASKWSAPPLDLSALFGKIGNALTLPTLPSTTIPKEDLPSDAIEARKKISSLVLDVANRRDIALLLTSEPAFGSKILGKLTAADSKLGDLSDSFARLGHKLTTPYANALGYDDVDRVVSTNKPIIADLRARAQTHEVKSKAADQDLRQSSQPFLSAALGLIQKERLRLNDEKRALDDLAASLAADAKKVQLEGDDITKAIEKNGAEVDALLATDRDLEATADVAEKKAEATGSEADVTAAKAARQEFETFHQRLPAALAKLGEEKEVILGRRDKNNAARDQLQRAAAAALVRYKAFESQQAGHNADEATVKEISF